MCDCTAAMGKGAQARDLALSATDGPPESSRHPREHEKPLQVLWDGELSQTHPNWVPNGTTCHSGSSTSAETTYLVRVSVVRLMVAKQKKQNSAPQKLSGTRKSECHTSIDSHTLW